MLSNLSNRVGFNDNDYVYRLYKYIILFISMVWVDGIFVFRVVLKFL